MNSPSKKSRSTGSFALFLFLWMLVLLSVAPQSAWKPCYAQEAKAAIGADKANAASSTRRQPLPPVKYELGEDSKKQVGVPEGRLEGPFLFRSKIIENTVRKYWISIPAQYDPSRSACVLVFQDGARSINPNGVIRVPQVLDNLIAKKKIPVTIGIYITPGQRGDEFPDSIGLGNPNNRDMEYDVLDDKYTRMLIDEILPEVGSKYNLTKEAAGRVIGGSSSGGICAFTVAWHRPDVFRNVVSFIGSFTNIHGGHVYPQLIRESPAKPIRIFLQDGKDDLRSPANLERDWHLQNQAMVAAFEQKKYDMAHVFGDGAHSDDHGGAILPEMLQWIWRDYPGIQAQNAEDLIRQARTRRPIVSDPFPGFDPKSEITPVGTWRWETSGNRAKSVQSLTLSGPRSKLSGNLSTTSVVNGEERTTNVPIENVELIGNKILFELTRSFRDQKMTSTHQGVISAESISGWILSEQNGSPRDTTWRANRVATTNNVKQFGLFESAGDVGAVLHAGTTRFDSQNQTYELTGSGKNMWAKQDEFHIVWKKMKGDFSVSASAKLLGQGVEAHRKLGCMIRSALETDSPYADATVHGDGSAALQYRVSKGADTLQVKSLVKSPDVIQLSRVGNKIAMALGKTGDPLSEPQSIELNLGDEVYVGLFVCSHNADVIEKAIFSNVRVSP
ncbi:MAG: alpha/beta hydrolase-fold protein [Pirellula sp.]